MEIKNGFERIELESKYWDKFAKLCEPTLVKLDKTEVTATFELSGNGFNELKRMGLIGKEQIDPIVFSFKGPRHLVPVGYEIEITYGPLIFSGMIEEIIDLEDGIALYRAPLRTLRDISEEEK